MKFPDDFINKIICGDCLEVMKEMPRNSIDAIVTDPPYGLEFMGKKWDRLMRKDRKVAYPSCRSGHGPDAYQVGLEMQLWHIQWLTEAYRVLKPGGSMLVMGGTRTSHRLACAIEDSGFIIKDTLMWIYGSGFPKAQDLGKMIDKRNGRNQELRKQLALYIREAIKKKGITLKAIRIQLNHKMKGGGLIPHWITEDSQPTVPTMKDWIKLKGILNLSNEWDWFIEREEAEREKIGETKQTYPDNHWMASNFAEGQTTRSNLDISNPTTDLAKHWDGFKVGGIKPAYEPIIWAVKPPEGSYVDNVLKWGVGAVNVDECRVGIDENDYKGKGGGGVHEHWIGKDMENRIYGKIKRTDVDHTKGRFPANIILSHHPECVQMGVKRVDSGRSEKPSDCDVKGNTSFDSMRGNRPPRGYGIEQVESWDCHPDCAVRLLDEQSGKLKSGGGIKVGKRIIRNTPFTSSRNYDDVNFSPDLGGASRFFYCAKASKSERGKDNRHPTVKPIALFMWLIQLVTREEQIILDPFIGSGTTILASQGCNRKCIGIEKDKDYCKIAEGRLAQGVL